MTNQFSTIFIWLEWATAPVKVYKPQLLTWPAWPSKCSWLWALGCRLLSWSHLFFLLKSLFSICFGLFLYARVSFYSTAWFFLLGIDFLGIHVKKGSIKEKIRKELNPRWKWRRTLDFLGFNLLRTMGNNFLSKSWLLHSPPTDPYFQSL